MAQPLKDSFGPDVPERIAAAVAAVYPGFDSAAFRAAALDGFEALELTPRARHIARALATYLPADPEAAIGVLVESLGPENADSALSGMASFFFMPHVFFVAEYGLDCFETSMRAQYELTRRFTAEFSIRAFIERHPEDTLARLKEWTKDPNQHVRRLVSEGTRPRLPWASRLRGFQEDPTPVFELLEELRDDPEEYVRRSVANNLNDISKDHPDLVIAVARRWWSDGTEPRKRLLRHALRTLVKAGHPEALAILGYGSDSTAEVARVLVDPTIAEIGGSVRIEIVVTNPADVEAHALVDLIVHFVKANGSTSAKVFKGRELVLDAGGKATIRKTVSLRQHSTRTHYPGKHVVEVLLNGSVVPGAAFEVEARN